MTSVKGRVREILCQERETTLGGRTESTEGPGVTRQEEEILAVTTEPAQPIVTESETQPPTPQILGNSLHCVLRESPSFFATHEPMNGRN